MTYVAAVEPIRYPDNAIVCGREDCANSGLIYLDDEEFWRYEHQGKRLYRLGNWETLKVELSDNIVGGSRRGDLIRPEEYGPDEDGDFPKYPESDSANWEG